MLTLIDLKKKVTAGDLTLTADQALDIPMLLNHKKGQVCDYDWDSNTVWLSIWNLQFTIINEK